MKKTLILLVLLGHFVVNAQSYKSLSDEYKNASIAGGTENSYSIAQKLTKDFAKDLKKNPVFHGELMNAIGNYHFQRTEYEFAIQSFIQASELIKLSVGDTALDFGLYAFNAACVYSKIGNYTEAEVLFYKTLPILAKGLGASSLDYTLMYKEYVEMLIERGDYSSAKPLNEALIYYFKTLYGEKNNQYLVCLNNAARIKQSTGDFNGAIEIFSSIITTQKNSGIEDSLNYSTMLNNLAEVYRQTSDYNAAEPLYLEAYQITKRFEKVDPAVSASLISNLGLLYKASGRYVEAEKCFLEAIKGYKVAGMGEFSEITNPLNNLGDLYRIMGRIGQAIDVLLKAKEIREKTVGINHEYYANTLVNLALVLVEVDRVDDAILLLNQSKDIYKLRLGESHQFYANVLNNLAMMYVRKGDLKNAETLKLKALQLTKDKFGENDRYAQYLGGMVSIYLKTKRYKEAEESLIKAGEIFKTKFGENTWDYLETQINLAYVYAEQKKYSESLSLYASSLLKFRNLYTNLFPGMSEDEKLQFYYNTAYRFGDFESVMIQAIQNKTQIDFASYYQNLYDFRLSLKSMLLDESSKVIDAIYASNNKEIKDDYEKWIGLKQDLLKLYRLSYEEQNNLGIDVGKLENEANILEKKLSTESSSFANMNGSLHVTWKEVQANLKPAEAAIEIFRCEQRIDDSTAKPVYAALIIKKESKNPALVIISEQNEFETEWLNHYKVFIEQKSIDESSYNRYWKSISNELVGIKKLYFSGDGVYLKINPNTLLDPVARKYILEQVEIKLVSSTRELAKKDRIVNQSKKIELYGFPDYEFDFFQNKKMTMTNAIASSRAGFTALAPLPGTHKEVNEILEVFKQNAWETSIFESEFANETQIKKVNSPRILHVATHGFFLPDEDFEDEKVLGFDKDRARMNPLLRSGIILAGAAVTARDSSIGKYDEDGILTAYEASLLNLKGTDLVVLSACETGLGEQVANGQGVYGLQRSFMVAGAKNIMMSLWTVDDFATQELMTEFYTQWLKNPTDLGRENAFRTAQMKIKEKYKSPYYWGAFIMCGK